MRAARFRLGESRLILWPGRSSSHQQAHKPGAPSAPSERARICRPRARPGTGSGPPRRGGGGAPAARANPVCRSLRDACAEGAEQPHGGCDDEGSAGADRRSYAPRHSSSVVRAARFRIAARVALQRATGRLRNHSRFSFGGAVHRAPQVASEIWWIAEGVSVLPIRCMTVS